MLAAQDDETLVQALRANNGAEVGPAMIGTFSRILASMILMSKRCSTSSQGVELLLLLELSFSKAKGVAN